MDLIESIIGNYPKLWSDWQHETHNSRQTKYSQRYPLSMQMLSTIMEFHEWVKETVFYISDKTGLPAPTFQQPSPSGPDPLVITRLTWINDSWGSVEEHEQLKKTVKSEITYWDQKISKHIGATDPLEFIRSQRCPKCNARTVMRINNHLTCVMDSCRTLDGGLLKWTLEE